MTRGWPTLAEKLATCSCLAELDGMLAQMRADGREPTSEEARAAQTARQRFLENER
jgi:hypothetical protein